MTLKNTGLMSRRCLVENTGVNIFRCRRCWSPVHDDDRVRRIRARTVKLNLTEGPKKPWAEHNAQHAMTNGHPYIHTIPTKRRANEHVQSIFFVVVLLLDENGVEGFRVVYVDPFALQQR